MKILVSWYAFRNDFHSEGEKEVNLDGPTYQFHKHFYKGYDKHIILSSRAENDGDPLLQKLVRAIQKDFDKHEITQRLLGISDVIDLLEIKSKVESLLLEFPNDEIDIFFSPGTSAMQLAWYICHQSLDLKTKLLQTRAGKFKGKVNPDLLQLSVEKSSTPISAVLSENRFNKQPTTSDYKITNTLKPIYEKAKLIANTDKVTCVIRGASGTGKEHLASFIHSQSTRSQKPFIAINCSAMNDQLLESRLFGYTKGAFTDAKEDKKGLLEEANGGSVFLDEIGDISAYMQQVLLRVIQSGECIPVGATKAKKIDVRFISATHKDLEYLCNEDKFRWDLYYRLSVVELELSTLHERGVSEKQEMIDFFLTKIKKDLKKVKKLSLEKKAKAAVLQYPFPGNIRELENLITRLYVFCDKTVSITDLPKRITQPTQFTSDNLNWKENEKELIKRALIFFEGNQSKANKALGYKSINTLRSKIKEYDI